MQKEKKITICSNKYKGVWCAQCWSPEKRRQSALFPLAVSLYTYTTLGESIVVAKQFHFLDILFLFAAAALSVRLAKKRERDFQLHFLWLSNWVTAATSFLPQIYSHTHGMRIIIITFFFAAQLMCARREKLFRSHNESELIKHIFCWHKVLRYAS